MDRVDVLVDAPEVSPVELGREAERVSPLALGLEEVARLGLQAAEEGIELVVGAAWWGRLVRATEEISCWSRRQRRAGSGMSSKQAALKAGASARSSGLLLWVSAWGAGARSLVGGASPVGLAQATSATRLK